MSIRIQRRKGIAKDVKCQESGAIDAQLRLTRDELFIKRHPLEPIFLSTLGVTFRDNPYALPIYSLIFVPKNVQSQRPVCVHTRRIETYSTVRFRVSYVEP